MKPQQAMLSGLIVNWRRFELSCWSQILESQSLAFSAGAAEWWFRLYELTIRGTLAASVDGSSSLDAYFAEMISLVETFLTAAPLGQYAARLHLLKSFGQYAKALSNVKHELESGALDHTSRILQNLHSFYHQFNGSVIHHLTERRMGLEKELLDYIKLATWKDINVHALKESAQRTHRRLYKCVRKLRELLREPVTPFLSFKPSEGAIQSSLPNCWTSDFIPLDPALPVVFANVTLSDGTPPYLLDLPLTFSKFTKFLKSHGEPIINAISFGFIDALAGQIADSATVLSTETQAAGNHVRLHKILMMRKKKAWVDLLQELKRAGLSSRLKPEILEHQQNKVWLMGRLTLTALQDTAFIDTASKAEDYLNRILLTMPELRRSLSSHHHDLPTPELQRATNFVESSFSLALSSQSRHDLSFFF